LEWYRGIPVKPPLISEYAHENTNCGFARGPRSAGVAHAPSVFHDQISKNKSGGEDDFSKQQIN
jgi:hypothetical protein